MCTQGSIYSKVHKVNVFPEKSHHESLLADRDFKLQKLGECGQIDQGHLAVTLHLASLGMICFRAVQSLLRKSFSTVLMNLPNILVLHSTQQKRLHDMLLLDCQERALQANSIFNEC